MKLQLKQATLGTFILGVLLASSASLVFAEDTSPSPSPRPRQELRKDIKEMHEDIRSDRSKIHAERLKRHFDFYAKRLTNIDTRIQSLIDKKHTAGKNTDAAQTQLNTAKATLAQAVTDGNKAVDMFNALTVATWDIQKPEVKTAITQAQLARKEFADSWSQSLQAVALLKNL